MFIPEECIGFHVAWLSDGKDEEGLDDLETVGLAKTIISVHHELNVSPDKDPDGLRILDDILHKLARYLDGKSWVTMDPIIKRDREFQVVLAKELVRNDKINLVEAVCLLYTKNELGIYGI